MMGELRPLINSFFIFLDSNYVFNFILAKSVSSDVKYIDLYKLNLCGCRVCLVCKRDEDICKCYWRDELSPLLDEIYKSDCLLIGVPIFFVNPTSHYMAFLERLIFSIVSYKTGNKFKGKINVGLFYCIEYPKDYFEESIRPHIKQSEDLLKMFNGEVVIDVFSNMPKNIYSTLSEEEIKLKEEELKKDLNRAFEIGVQLSK